MRSPRPVLPRRSRGRHRRPGLAARCRARIAARLIAPLPSVNRPAREIALDVRRQAARARIGGGRNA